MAVEEFLNAYRNSMLNKKTINPLSVSNNRQAQIDRSGFGTKIPNWLNSRKSAAVDSYMNSKSDRTTNIAKDYAEKAAGQVPTNEYGIVQDKETDFSSAFNQQLGTIGNRGKAALATEEAKSQWQHLQGLQELGAGYQISTSAPLDIPPGASGDNPGARAVAIAMQAVKNNTPYVWAGNSLTKGVDCSGLIQQVYKQLGINVPRSTYEQAKQGKVISMGSLLPGDLVFYNTGSRDPNGIGQFSHVAIYIGNGQVIEAPGRGKTVRISNINGSGTPSRAVRPW